jgi:large subunit ribosomal protein L24
MKIKKGDRVVVLQGKDRGKEGVVMRALPSSSRASTSPRSTRSRPA